MAYQDLTARERITLCHIDFLRDPDFARIGGATQIGKVDLVDRIPTAGTNGADVFYNEQFVLGMSREQLRYLVAHEQVHKLLEHCVSYQEIRKKHPQLSNMAMDYVVNQFVEELGDAAAKRLGKPFVMRPTAPKPLIDPKYQGWSWLEVLEDLLKNPPPPQDSAGGSGAPGGGSGEPLDAHEDGEARTPEEVEELKKQLQDARVQGEMASKRMRGTGDGGAKLGGYIETNTDWRTPMLQFLQEAAEGDEFSRWTPPNKRLLPLGILMPSHYDERAGEIIIAADTSGSMMPYYGRLFGEVGRFLQLVNPAKVTVLWWGDSVEAVQEFAQADYADIKNKLKPVGGGDTTVSCVARWLRAHKRRPQALIYMTDGYIESQYEVPDVPCLWGVIDNSAFRPLKGKVVHIQARSL